MVNVQYEDQEVNLPLIIIKGADKATLLGLQWLEQISSWTSRKYAACKDLYQESWGNTRGLRRSIGYAEENHCQDLCRQRPTTQDFQTKFNYVVALTFFRSLKTFRLTLLRMCNKCKIVNVQRNNKALSV